MTESGPVRLVIVGCGSITTTSHLPAVLRSNAVTLHALVDAKGENAYRMARTFGLKCKIATRLSDVIDGAEGVIVATPNSTHVPVAREALEAGAGVLVEKPLATNLADGEALCDLAEAKGLPVAVGYKSRFYPAVILLRHLIETRFLGELHSFYYEFGSRGGSEPLSGYNLSRATAGGGALIVSATHFLDRMLYWFGVPETFEYYDDNHGGIESTCKADMRFNNDLGIFSGAFFVSQTMVLSNRFVVEAEHYTCEIGDSQTDSVTLYPRRNPELRMEVTPDCSIAAPKKDYFQAQVEDFAESIRTGRKPRVDGRFALRSMRLIEEMYSNRRQLDEPWMMWRERESTVYA